MNDLQANLLSLQHGDSFFPSGSVAFSFGLETLREDGRVSREDDVCAFVIEQLRGRWSTMDWGLLAAAWDAAGDIRRLIDIDALQDAMILPRELRDGSKKAGRALLTVHRALDTPGISELARAVGRGDANGHLIVVQGAAWAGCGLTAVQCGLVSGHAFVVGMLGAALRLGVIGHIGAQRILSQARPEIERALRHPPPALDRVHSFTPCADVAAMRHEAQSSRLFST